jgi:hypothetical protein
MVLMVGKWVKATNNTSAGNSNNQACITFVFFILISFAAGALAGSTRTPVSKRSYL